MKEPNAEWESFALFIIISVNVWEYQSQQTLMKVLWKKSSTSVRDLKKELRNM